MERTDVPARQTVRKGRPRFVTIRPGLSKSRFIAGTQCHLRLWYESYERELASAPDDALQAIFDTGHEVGEVACRRYPGGHRVAHDHHHIPQALSETRQVLRAGIAPALFEAAFEHERVLVRADVLQRLPTGGWRLIEVKSSTRLKDVFILDVAVQLWVLRGAGLDVRDAGVLTLNRDYVYYGVRLDLHSLFELHPVFDEACALLDTVGSQVREMLTMLAESTAPDIAPGDHCFIPYECPFHGHCTRDHVTPQHGIDELPRLSAQRRIQLETAGIEEIRDVSADFPLTLLQRQPDPLSRSLEREVSVSRDDLHVDGCFLFAEYDQIVGRCLAGTRDQHTVSSQESTRLGDLLGARIRPFPLEVAQLTKRTGIEPDGRERVEVGESHGCLKGNAQFEELVTNL